MKTIKILFAIIVAFITTQSAYSQSDKTQRTIGIKTQTIKVYGECSMCKKRIETAAAKVDGVNYAYWNEDSKTLTIKYSVFKKDVAENVQKNISAAGYDTERFTADNTVYNKLPECCHYQRKQS